MIGQTISHYTILDKLGEGGMGVVYKAEDTTLKRVVALKFLPQHVSSSATDKARFLLEAQAAAALNHPNICTIHGIEEHSGQTFIVMEFVDGQTLRDKLGTLALAKAIDIGVQVAEGLSVAHEKGIVHRDIKPENIMVRKDGLVQVMDFGLAKLRASRASRLTKEGSTIGTAGYMSPEQIQGQETDHRSDIFSLGVLLYELFTGELPFKGVHETALLYEIVNVDPAPMSSIKPEIDPELDRIVLECLQKEPDERYNSVKDIAKDLKRFKRESSRDRASRITAARPVLKNAPAPEPAHAERGWSWTARGGYILAGAMAAGMLLWVFGPWGKTPVLTRPVMRFGVDLPLDAPPHLSQAGPAISRDGTTIAYVANVQNSRVIYIHRMDQPNFQPLPGSDGASEPAFSPDGRWIVFCASFSKIVKVPVSGGAPEVLCPIPSQSRGIVWATDNFIYFGLVSGGIARVPASGGALETVTDLDSSAGEISHRFPQLLPDKTTLVYTVKQNSITTFDDAIIVAERIGSGERKLLVRGGMAGRYLPTGHLVYARARTLYAVAFDAGRMEVTGTPVAMEHGVSTNRGSGEGSFDLSENGVIVSAPAGPFNNGNISMGWMDRQGVVTSAFDTLRSYQSSSVSPDGEKFSASINAANNDIWVIQIARGLLTRLTFAGGNNDEPLWTPDGRFIIYAAERGSSPNLFRRPWDGSGSEERLTRSGNSQNPISMSPDGRSLAFSEKGDIWVLPVDSASAMPAGEPAAFIQSAANEGSGNFSPDGRWMAYRSDESGKSEVYVTAYPKRERKWQISNGGGNFPRWARDGRELFYLSGTTIMAVDVLGSATFDFSIPRKLCDVPPNTTFRDIAPGGKRFLVHVRHLEESTRPQFSVSTEWFDAVKERTAANSSER